MFEDFDGTVPLERRRVISDIRRRMSFSLGLWENLGRILGGVICPWLIGAHVSRLLLNRGYNGSQTNAVRAAIQSLSRTLARTIIRVRIRRNPDAVSVERILKTYEFVSVDCFTGDLVLSPSARREWWEEVLAIIEASEPTLLSEMAGDRATTAQLQWLGNQYIAIDGDELLGVWPSRSAFIADAAADRVFRSRFGYWDQLSTDQRSRILIGFRLFLDECPTCEGEVSISVGSTHVSTGEQPISGICQGCNDRLFEFVVTDGRTQGVNR